MSHPNSRNPFERIVPPTHPLALILNGGKGHTPHLPPLVYVHTKLLQLIHSSQ